MKIISNLHPTEFSRFTRTLHTYKDSSVLCSKVLLVLVTMMVIMIARASLVPLALPIWKMPFYLHFTEKKSEAERGKSTCPRSHSRWVAKLGFEPRQSGS